MNCLHLFRFAAVWQLQCHIYHYDIYKAVSVFTREGEDFLIVEQTETIISDAGKDAVAKEKAVARNVKSVSKYKIKVEFGDAPMEDLMVSYIDRKASLKFR